MNEPFGWACILAGFLSGAALGLFFGREQWLGGYASHRRRLLRLGHIAFIGLGLLNILFALSAERVTLPAAALGVASWGLMVGAVTMPLCCGLMAWRKTWHGLFVVPVASLVTAAALIVWGLTRGLTRG